MKIIDLCCGLKSWVQPWIKNNHEVITLDINPIFNPDICINILDYYPKENFDVVFASPPCTYFSKIRNIWNNTPLKTTPEQIQNSIDIAQKCFDISKKSKYYCIENPAFGMRKYFPNDYITIDYCAYNYHINYWIESKKDYAYIKKPTDIWSNINFEKLRCNKKYFHIGLVECIRNPIERSKIPKKLVENIYNVLVPMEL